MKKVSLYLLSLITVGAMVLSFSSCTEETKPAPTLSIFSSVDGYQVAFTATAQNADSFAWNFGDGNNSTEQNPVHVYEQSGSFTASCTATGGGGTVTKTVDVTIAASKLEMLTGGPAMANGKAWKISTTASEGDGVYKADADFTPESVVVDGVLGLIGIPEEYDDEFTFVHDLSYVHDVKNDSSVTGTVYAMLNQLGFRATLEDGVVLAPFTPASATFTFTEDTDLALTVVNPDDEDQTMDVTYTGVDVLEITDPEFVLLHTAVHKYIIFDIATDKMVIGVFLEASEGTQVASPSHMLRMTMVPK